MIEKVLTFLMSNGERISQTPEQMTIELMDQEMMAEIGLTEKRVRKAVRAIFRYYIDTRHTIITPEEFASTLRELLVELKYDVYTKPINIGSVELPEWISLAE